MLRQIYQIWLPLHYLGYDFTNLLLNHTQRNLVDLNFFFFAVLDLVEELRQGGAAAPASGPGYMLALLYRRAVCTQ